MKGLCGRHTEQRPRPCCPAAQGLPQLPNPPLAPLPLHQGLAIGPRCGETLKGDAHS